MSEAPQEEAKVQDSQVFMIEGRLQDAWGRPADADEAVDFRESRYQSMTVPQLKDEVKARQAAGREFDTSAIKTKRDVIAALEADDEAQIQEAKDAGDGDNDPE